jgi:hypothetical protein
MISPKRMSSSLPRTHNSPGPCTPGKMYVHFVSCPFYVNILLRRSTSFHITEMTSDSSPRASKVRSTSFQMTEMTSDSSPRASKVRRAPPCSALLAIKWPGWNLLLMGTRVISKLCDLFLYRSGFNSRLYSHSPIHSLSTSSTSCVQCESGDIRSQQRRPIHYYGGLGPLS